MWEWIDAIVKVLVAIAMGVIAAVTRPNRQPYQK